MGLIRAIRLIGLIGIISLAGNTACFAGKEASLVKQANKLYNNGKIDEALEDYNKALTQAPEEPLIHFNIAGALYKKSQYDEAIKEYQQALFSSDKYLEAKANYNIGNCKFRQGKIKEIADLAGAIEDYRAALDYYKRAIELDPADKDAKFNHEFTERLLKSLIDKLAKQQKHQEQQEQK